MVPGTRPPMCRRLTGGPEHSTRADAGRLKWGETRDAGSEFPGVVTGTIEQGSLRVSDNEVWVHGQIAANS